MQNRCSAKKDVTDNMNPTTEGTENLMCAESDSHNAKWDST